MNKAICPEDIDVQDKQMNWESGSISPLAFSEFPIVEACLSISIFSFSSYETAVLMHSLCIKSDFIYVSNKL